MSDHLPECLMNLEYAVRVCICPELRACEQRVLLSKPHIELSAVYGYEAGRDDGLAAARDAVAAVFVSKTPMEYHAHFALAAIDALRANADTSTDDGARRVPMQNLPKETP